MVYHATVDNTEISIASCGLEAIVSEHAVLSTEMKSPRDPHLLPPLTLYSMSAVPPGVRGH